MRISWALGLACAGAVIASAPASAAGWSVNTTASAPKRLAGRPRENAVRVEDSLMRA